MSLIQTALSKIQSVYDKWQQKPLSPVQQPLEAPKQSLSNRFWTSKPAQALGKAQEFIESPKQFKPFPTAKITPEMGSKQKLKREIVNFPSNWANSIIGKGLLGPVSDVTQNVGRIAGGRDIAPYQQLKSAQARLGYNIAGQQRTGKEIVGNIAGTIEPILDAYIPKGGKAVLKGSELAFKQTFKKVLGKGFKEGAKFGSAYGLINALSEGRAIENERDYQMNIATGVTVGALFGGLLSGAVAGSGWALGKIKNRFQEALVNISTKKLTPKQSKIVADRMLRDEMGRFVGKKPRAWEKDKKFVGELGLSTKEINTLRKEANKNRVAMGLPPIDYYEGGFISTKGVKSTLGVDKGVVSAKRAKDSLPASATRLHSMGE